MCNCILWSVALKCYLLNSTFVCHMVKTTFQESGRERLGHSFYTDIRNLVSQSKEHNVEAYNCAFLSLVTGTLFLPGWSYYTQVGLPTKAEFWRMESTRPSTPGTDPRLPSGSAPAPRWWWWWQRWQQWPRVCQKTETLGLSSRWQHQARGWTEWATEAAKTGKC